MGNTPGYELELVPCTLCGGESFDDQIVGANDLYNHLDGEFNVVRCRSCGFSLTNPRPTRETIGHFYPDSTGYYQPEDIDETRSRRERLYRSVLANYYDYPLPRRSKIVDFFCYLRWRLKIRINHTPTWHADGRLLDIGCSWGRYLKIMQSYGWNVYGLEFNKQAVEYAQEKLGLGNVRQGMIEDAGFEDNFFDVVHMSMVLEHLHDPKLALEKIAVMLKPGGELIISVPNFASYEANKYGAKWYALQVPGHLNHFTPTTLRKAVEASGLEIQQFVFHKTERDFINSSKNAGRNGIARFLRFSPVRNLLLRPFVSALARRGKTGRMSVYARKPS